jgi:hypothetical protein
MPIHDWTRVDAGLFHHFHQDWTIEICRTLNRGLLPLDYLVMTDQWVEGPDSDMITVRECGFTVPGGLAMADAPPRARQVARVESDAAAYAQRANRIVVRHQLGPVVAAIEVVSPGNKDSRHTIRAFTAKAIDFLRGGVNLVVIDLFPPTPRDPAGTHQVIWDELSGVPFEPRPADKPLTVASYDAGGGLTAYVDPVAVGDDLPDAALFLAPGWYVTIPLERTYQASWDVTPRAIRELLGTMPGGDQPDD